MRDEFWATFSIYDHRSELYRQALVLFDRIVVPIPTRPISDLTNQEIEHLAGEVEFLATKGAAEAIPWDPDEFALWRQEAKEAEAGQQEALARRLAGDPPFQTRLQLQEKTAARLTTGLPPDVASVTPVPLFGSDQAYERAASQLRGYIEEKLTIEVLLPRIPVPGPTVSFDDIAFLRDKPSFKASLAALRRWQRQTVAEVLADPSPRALERAAGDFDSMIKSYASELDDARYTKITTGITSALAIGSMLVSPAAGLVAALATVASPIFSVRALMRPCWKDVEEKRCFPAGVVYEASRLS